MQNISKLILLATLIGLIGCQANDNNPGIEYAPQMYHSVAYEPLSQITDESLPTGPISGSYYIPNSLPFNDYQGKKPMNMKKPVEGTVPRQNYKMVTNSSFTSTDQALLYYDLPADSVDMAGKILKNPLPETDAVIAKGKHLYIAYCQPCHGAAGDGQGKVGEVYKGIPNFGAGRYATLPEGHLFHVITHGKGRMWPYNSQLDPQERWAVVRYVQKLQKGEK